jgi:hypothetical protein
LYRLSIAGVIMRTVVLGLVCSASVASAAPMTMSWQGRALDGAGVPIDGGSHSVVVEMWTSSTTIDETNDRLHVESFSTVAPESGFFALTLGTGTVLDSGIFSNEEVWMDVTVDGSTMGVRTLLTSVPMSGRSVETARFSASAAACDGSVAADVGLVRFTGTDFEGCTASGWLPFTPVKLGLSVTTPALSCFHIKTVDAGAANGTYWLDPNNTGSFEAYCDMDAGGWTLVARMTVAGNQAHWNTGTVGVTGTTAVSVNSTSTQKFADSRINAIRLGSTYTGTTAYRMSCWDGTGNAATMFCSSSCAFNAVNSVNTSECSRCTGSLDGALVQLAPNTGTRGLGHHHDPTYSWSMAYQRHPEQGNNAGCRNDLKSSGDGHLWIR